MNELLRCYNQVRNLLNQAQALEQRFKSVPVGLVDIFQDKLVAWSLQITSELSSDKLQALANEPPWRGQFEDIQQGFEKQLQAERDRFASIQVDYKSFLKDKFPTIETWTEVIFNQTEPQDSYNRLWNGVHEALKRVVEQVRLRVQDIYDRAARLQGGSLSNLLPVEHAAAQSQLDNLLTQLTEHRQRTNNWAANVAEPGFMDRVREHGATTSAEVLLKPVIGNITKHTQGLPSIERSILELEQKVLAFSLSPEEEAVLTELNTLQRETNADDGVELGLLLQSMDDQEGGWKLIAQLYSKQRLRLKIAPVVFN